MPGLVLPTFCPFSLISVHLTFSETMGMLLIFLVKYKLRQFNDDGLITTAVTNYPCLFLGLFSLLLLTHTTLKFDFSL